MDTNKIYKEILKYPEYFDIADDFVSFKIIDLKMYPIVKKFIDIITSTDQQTILFTDMELYEKFEESYRNGETSVKGILVNMKFSNNDDCDFLYDNILWVNTKDGDEVLLVFNWDKYINIINSI